MAADGKVADALRGVRKHQLRAFLDTDPRVREWLADGAVIGVNQAAELLDVERSRIWRWTEAGKITALYDTGATKLYMRADLERMLREDPPQRRSRRDDDDVEAPAA